MAQINTNYADLTLEELQEKISNEKVAYKKMKFTHAISSVESPVKLRFMRREIARMLTELRKRQITHS